MSTSYCLLHSTFEDTATLVGEKAFDTDTPSSADSVRHPPESTTSLPASTMAWSLSHKNPFSQFLRRDTRRDGTDRPEEAPNPFTDDDFFGQRDRLAVTTAYVSMGLLIILIVAGTACLLFGGPCTTTATIAGPLLIGLAMDILLRQLSHGSLLLQPDERYYPRHWCNEICYYGFLDITPLILGTLVGVVRAIHLQGSCQHGLTDPKHLTLQS